MDQTAEVCCRTDAELLCETSEAKQGMRLGVGRDGSAVGLVRGGKVGLESVGFFLLLFLVWFVLIF